MNRLLAWREAERADRQRLQQFVCTVPARRAFQQKRPSHPRPWELAVQSGIRALRPPMPEDQLLLIGEDDQGVAAVCLLADQGGAQAFKIQAVAIATRHRGVGGSCSAEAMDVALEAAAEQARKRGLGKVALVGWVDPRNTASKRMNQRAGLALRRITRAGLEEWVAVLDLTE
jgi:hypothetical protein